MSLTLVDYICILVCGLSGFIGYNRGAIKTLISIGGFIASFAIAWIFAPILGDFLLNQDVVIAFLDGLNLESAVQTFLNAGSQQEVIGNASVGQAIFIQAQDLMNQGVEVITQTLMNGIAWIISFGLLLIVSSIFFGILQVVFSGISDIPIIGGINRLSGLALGLVLGFAICVIVLWIIAAFNTYTGAGVNLPNFEGSEIIKFVTPWVMNSLGIK